MRGTTMDSRFLLRAYIKSLKWILPVRDISYSAELVILEMEDGGDFEYGFDDVVLMQCTGLTAVKSYRGDSAEDRLIWEGDVVRFNGLPELCGVSWHEGGWCVRHDDGDEAIYYRYLFSVHGYCEIICTIYGGGLE